MKVVGLNGKPYNLNLNDYLVAKNDERKRSIPHIRARELLQDSFKGYAIYEEVKLPGSRDPSKKSVLFLDFFIPNVKVGVEVHGIQHYVYSPFFHKTVAGFYESIYRDKIKKEWCDINNIELIILDSRDHIDTWREQLECF